MGGMPKVSLQFKVKIQTEENCASPSPQKQRDGQFNCLFSFIHFSSLNELTERKPTHGENNYKVSIAVFIQHA